MAWLQYRRSDLRSPKITSVLISRIFKRINSCFDRSISLFSNLLCFKIESGRYRSISCISCSLNIFRHHYCLLLSLHLKFSYSKLFRTIALSWTPMIWLNNLFKFLFYVVLILTRSLTYSMLLLRLGKSECAQTAFQIINIFLGCCH